jgi:arylsulfatase A-like enzyme
MQNQGRGDPPLPLVQQENVIEAPADQATLTQRYTREAVAFIEANQSKPFFLYLPHTFPHLPLFASPAFHGTSQNGRYGDTVEEIDWSTGEIMRCLDRLGLTRKTLVLFTSDNGSNGRNGGSNAPLAGTKGSTMEGGMRVPMIVRWPGTVPAGATCAELATTMDVLPTFCALAGAELPDAQIDGFDIRSLLTDAKDAASPYEALFYYRRRQLQAVRWGEWKYHLELKQTYPNWTTANTIGKGRPGKLVNLKNDLRETTDVSRRNPEVMKRMTELADQAIVRLGNDDQKGGEQREAKTLPSSAPMILRD